MKMRFINRLMLALYALICLLLVIGTLLALIVPGVIAPAADEVKQLFEAIPFLNYILLAIMAVWSLSMFLLAFKRGGKKLTKTSNVALQNTENGAVHVSVHALEALIKEVIGQNDEVLEIKSQVINHEDSITVAVQMVLTTTAHIPNITMIMQRNIKRYIEEYSGIAVREVVITVTDVRSPEAASGKRGLKNAKTPETIMAPATPLPEKKTEAPEQTEVEAISAPVQELVQEPVETPMEEPVQEISSAAAYVPELVLEPTPQQSPEVVETIDDEQACEAAADEAVVEQAAQEDLPFECFVKKEEDESAQA